MLLVSPVPTSSSKSQVGGLTGAYADGNCQVQNGKTVIGAGVYHPLSDPQKLVEPNGAGIINTIGRAELAVIAAALTPSES
eukprot:404313-Pelagomonas_calceolata.AAC.1